MTSVSSKLLPGALTAFPRGVSAEELLKGAKRQSFKIKPDTIIRNPIKRARKLSAERLDVFTKQITQPLGVSLKQIELLAAGRTELHPLDTALLHVMREAWRKSGDKPLLSIINDAKELRKQVLSVGRGAAAGAASARNKAISHDTMVEGQAAMSELVSSGSLFLKELDRIHKALRHTPTVNLQVPVVALVGMPNVGKSSIVRQVSSGTPTVSNYPFTTRQMVVGHVRNKGIKGQVMDTPGLLHRPADEFNAMELLTLATVEHIPSAIIFVTDCSGSAGSQSALAHQIRVREMVKQTAEARSNWNPSLWLDVISKVDLGPVDDEAKAHSETQIALGAMPMSCNPIEPFGTEQLEEWIHDVVVRDDLMECLNQAAVL